MDEKRYTEQEMIDVMNPTVGKDVFYLVWGAVNVSIILGLILMMNINPVSLRNNVLMLLFLSCSITALVVSFSTYHKYCKLLAKERGYE